MIMVALRFARPFSFVTVVLCFVKLPFSLENIYEYKKNSN